MSFLICDLECHNIPYMGQVASPFCPDNYIVAPGWALDAGEVHHEYFPDAISANTSDWFERAIQTATVFVAHNATFEIQWMLHRHRDAFLGFIKRGGRIYCTQYAEYLLSHQTETYPKLDEVAPRYGGTHKIDEVKLLWEQGVLTADIDRELLIKYLAGASGDIENTRRVCFGQYVKLVANDMLDMFWERMDSLLFNAVCTFNGLYVDMEVAERNHKEQLQRVLELKDQINTMLPKDMPKELEFNFGSDYNMSAFLFGGPIKYPVKVSYDPIKYEKADFYKDEDGTRYQLDAPSIDWDFIQTYTSGKNKGMPKVFREDTDVEKLKWGEAIYYCDGLINLTELPQHVAEQYLGKRAEFKGKRTLCDDCTPVYSTGKDSLDLLAVFTPAAKPLKELAQLEKDNGTYYITHEYAVDGSIKHTKGMLQYVGVDGIIHHQLNGTSTITGRLSSSNPNL